MKNRLAIFASGNGSNAENIIRYFLESDTVEVVLVLSNSPKAKVLERARSLNISVATFSKEDFYMSEAILKRLLKEKIDWIILAGFLLKFPEPILQHYKNKVINIHPALLPKFGGKGMYGMHIHKAVVENKESETGITIHYVNENYDEGKIIFQAKTEVLGTDTPEIIAEKIHILEQHHFPKVIENLIINNKNIPSFGGGQGEE
ncbi:MAG: phosphoribosylglycinamide formyltransferase [Flavobacteriaceae bacterium CG_4_8_14_3_um_filter_34_10]|nr:phosphoribosylglycinamide formyltransferase [Flavobacteriia bacterium]OIP50680.1 MAG: phosphoribosylglycinamide formyltransferase [Flavobacteriaceae bacterium CG2_30_34_30]PIQ18125.1 MAG: phosphoribosylglycinamide formyltransferase [Flavobacteriaceae bacterium CG18_big_fil_WC_8_21_14_2_50_34_36]PIV51304.1 MAG: phosphoribosylglycinamide formyltransferase [Flavobacteriaceae bacterium CG02_land_8_20_14_3_00_34_13]PIX10249.1 MAG: phosphoribosylglycinamide formyltransferase [Flavobacteriaceae bac